MRWRIWALRGGFSIRAIPGLAQLGGVWLPLPHLLMLPFVRKMEWWQNGLAGAWPSLAVLHPRRGGLLPAVPADAGAALGAGGDGVLCAESEPAVSVDDGDDGAAVSGAAGLDDAADGGVRRRDSRGASRRAWRGG